MNVVASRPHYRDPRDPIARLLPSALGVTLVASYTDLVRAVRGGLPNIVLAQHGIGQSYGGDTRTADHPG